MVSGLNNKEEREENMLRIIIIIIIFRWKIRKINENENIPRAVGAHIIIIIIITH